MKAGYAPASPDTRAEIASLIEVLHATDRRLEQLLGPGVESVTDRQGHTLLLRRAQERLRQGESARQAAILGALPAHVALLDVRGVIVSVNAAWRQFADANALRGRDHGVGADYLEICDRAGTDDAEAAQAAAGIRSVLRGEAKQFVMEYPCHSPTLQRWFLLRVAPLADGPQSGAVVMHTDITQRRQAADALAELSRRTERQERMLNTALSSITDFTYIVDGDGRLVFANQPVLDLWGVGQEQALGMNVHDLGYPPQLAERIQRQLQHVFSTGGSVRDETAYVSPAGESGYYEYSFSPAFGADGRVEFVVGCTRDITARKRSELALRDSVAEFHTLAAAMPQIVWTTGADGRTTYLGPQWVEYTGRSPDASLGDDWSDLLHPDDRERARAAWQQTVARGGTYSTELRMRRADGVYRWWLVRAAPVLDDAGRPVKWIGTGTDIDELKAAEQEISRANRELQRQRTELRVLFDIVPAKIWFKDTENNILRANKRGAESVGRTVEEVEGRPIAEFFPRQAAAFHASDLQIIRSGLPIMGQVELEQDEAGDDMWQQKDKVPYHDENGNVIGIVVMSHDISQRKRDQDALQELNATLEDRVRVRTAELALARDEAEQANRAKSAFLATMSHEIRTPMNGLLGLLELLDLSSLDAGQRSTLTVAREAGNALLRIIDDILDFSKIEANCLELNPVGASVGELVESACRLHNQVASSKNLTLRAHVSADVGPHLSFDPMRVGQILNNFLNNAIKFTEQGSVELRVERAGGGPGTQALRFMVRDTGIGIAPEDLGRLFQPFVQGTAETTARFGGTGLGLAISRRLAELMGGSVEIESVCGKGTTLTLSVSFPVCDAGRHPPVRSGNERELLDAVIAGRRAAPSIPQAQADGSLLLVVDDHPINRMLLLRQVASLGYAAEAAEDGVQALEAWQSGRFAAVLTDCNMPRMNGYELASTIRELEKTSGANRTPIIGCTANALPAAVASCTFAGMDDCVVKPTDLAELGRTLDRWLPLPGPGRRDGPPALMRPANTRQSALSEQGLVDRVLLAEIAGADPQAQAAILADFRRVNERDAAALRCAAASNEYAQVVSFSHRIKGASLMLGATLLARACGQLEAAAVVRDTGKVAAAIADFEMELLRLTRHVDSHSSTELPHGS